MLQDEKSWDSNWQRARGAKLLPVGEIPRRLISSLDHLTYFHLTNMVIDKELRGYCLLGFIWYQRIDWTNDKGSIANRQRSCCAMRLPLGWGNPLWWRLSSPEYWNLKSSHFNRTFVKEVEVCVWNAERLGWRKGESPEDCATAEIRFYPTHPGSPYDGYPCGQLFVQLFLMSPDLRTGGHALLTKLKICLKISTVSKRRNPEIPHYNLKSVLPPYISLVFKSTWLIGKDSD